MQGRAWLFNSNSASASPPFESAQHRCSTKKGILQPLAERADSFRCASFQFSRLQDPWQAAQGRVQEGRGPKKAALGSREAALARATREQLWGHWGAPFFFFALQFCLSKGDNGKGEAPGMWRDLSRSLKFLQHKSPHPSPAPLQKRSLFLWPWQVELRPSRPISRRLLSGRQDRPHRGTCSCTHTRIAP